MKTNSITSGIRTATAALLLVISFSSPVAAQVDAMVQARITATFGLMSPKLLKALNLTPEQSAKIEAGKDAFREAQRAYLNEVRVLRKEVGDKLFGSNRVTEADVARQIAKIAELREKILRDGFKIALDVRNALTPEQLAKAAAIRQQLQEIQSEVRELYNETQ
ncbi:MAG TPA: Spy/CpxP family protein refolding chaperone [Candidatus Binatia bacterium]|jgi:Spy/CpxP family protein refolding chaperone